MLTYGRRRNGRPFFPVFHDEEGRSKAPRKAPSGSSLDTDTVRRPSDASDNATESLLTHAHEIPPTELREVALGNKRHSVGSSKDLRSEPVPTSSTRMPSTRVPSYVRNKPLPPVPPQWDLPVGDPDPTPNFTPLADKSTNRKLGTLKLPGKTALSSKSRFAPTMSQLDPPDDHLTALPRLPSGLKIFARTSGKASDSEPSAEDELKPTRSRGIFRGLTHAKSLKSDNSTPSTHSRESKHVFGKVKDAITEHFPSRTSSSRRRSRRHTMLDEDELSLTRAEEDEDLTVRVQRRLAVEQALQESPKLQQLFDSPTKPPPVFSAMSKFAKKKAREDKPRTHSYSMSDLNEIHKALNESCESLEYYDEEYWGDPFTEAHQHPPQFPPRLDSQMFAGFDPSFNLPSDLRNVSLHGGTTAVEPASKHQGEEHDSISSDDGEGEEDVTMTPQNALLLAAAMKKVEIPKTVPILLKAGGPATRPIDPLRSHPDVMSFAEMPERVRAQDAAHAASTADRESSSDESGMPSITITSSYATRHRKGARLSKIEESKVEESPPDAQSTPRGAYWEKRNKREGFILQQSPLKRLSAQSDNPGLTDNRWEFHPEQAVLYNGEPYDWHEGNTLPSAGSSRRHSWIPESNSNRGSKDSKASSGQASSGQTSSKRHSWAGSDSFKRNSADAGLLVEQDVEPKKKKRHSPESISDLITNYAHGPTDSWYSVADDMDSSPEVTMIFSPLPEASEPDIAEPLMGPVRPPPDPHKRLSLPPALYPTTAPLSTPILFPDRSAATITNTLLSPPYRGEDHTPTKTVGRRNSFRLQKRDRTEKRKVLKQRQRAGSESLDELARDQEEHKVGAKKKWRMGLMGRAGA